MKKQKSIIDVPSIKNRMEFSGTIRDPRLASVRPNSNPIPNPSTCLYKFLGDTFDPTTDVSADSSDDKPLYLSFHCFGPIAEKLKTELLLLLAKYYREKKFQVILVNGFTTARSLTTKISCRYACSRPLSINIVVYIVHLSMWA